MILECSNCSTRFIVKDALLLPDGRKVKCAKCKHIWFQDPPITIDESDDLDEAPKIVENAIPDFDEIPESVKPIPEGSNLPTLKEKPETSLLYCFYMVGYALAILFVISVPFRHEITKIWAPASAIYETVGLKVHALGEQIAIEDLKLEEKKFPNGRTVVNFDVFLKNKYDKEVWVPNIKIDFYPEEVTSRLSTSLNYEPVFYKLLPGQSTRIREEFSLDNLNAEKAIVSFSERVYKETPFDE